MPIVEADILEGYSTSDKSRLSAALTQGVRLVVPAPDEAITVMLHEYPGENYARAGKHRNPAPALPDPKEIVLAYLARMEARDLPGAQALLGEGFEMIFPGTAPMTLLEDLIEWAAPRYRSVTKTFDSVEAFQGEGVAVVYTRGTLRGLWSDGSRFENIRFIDRFELSGGLITRQEVWNDMGEVRPT